MINISLITDVARNHFRTLQCGPLSENFAEPVPPYNLKTVEDRQVRRSILIVHLRHFSCTSLIN
jgi:hypothetical protein